MVFRQLREIHFFQTISGGFLFIIHQSTQCLFALLFCHNHTQMQTCAHELKGTHSQLSFSFSFHFLLGMQRVICGMRDNLNTLAVSFCLDVVYICVDILSAFHAFTAFTHSLHLSLLPPLTPFFVVSRRIFSHNIFSRDNNLLTSVHHLFTQHAIPHDFHL